MRITNWIVAALLRIYPKAWRSEYGAELTDLLLARPLDARTIGDVLWNGVRQRLRSTEPSTRCGLAMMLVMLTGFMWDIATPAHSSHDLAVLLQESSKTLPTVSVRPLTSELYVLFLVGCGCWTHLRYGGTPTQSGMGALKISFIAGIPVMLVGLLMSIGALGVAVLGAGDVPATSHQHLSTGLGTSGFTFTYFSAQRHPPTALGVLVAPLFRLPESWMWGVLGGLLGRWISSSRHSAVAGA